MWSSLIETKYGWLVMPDICEDRPEEDVIHEVHFLGSHWIVYAYKFDFMSTVSIR
jgi:hypothetical protein